MFWRGTLCSRVEREREDQATFTTNASTSRLRICFRQLCAIIHELLFYRAGFSIWPETRFSALANLLSLLLLNKLLNVWTEIIKCPFGLHGWTTYPSTVVVGSSTFLAAISLITFRTVAGEAPQKRNYNFGNCRFTLHILIVVRIKEVEYWGQEVVILGNLCSRENCCDQSKV